MDSRLYGRDDDLRTLDALLADARAGRGGLVAVTGEGGIGKTSLLDAVARRADGLHVLRGAAWEAGGAPPWWLWIQVLRDAATLAVPPPPGADQVARLVPEWGSAAMADPDPATARFALLDGAARALLALAHRAPLLVVLDDLHAADLASLELLDLLARQLARAPLAVVCAWRDAEVAVAPERLARLARAVRAGTVLPLARLGGDDVRAWVGAEGLEAGDVLARTDGVPLFVAEVLLAARARRPIPAVASRAVVAGHLALVSDRARELLAAASVLGRDWDPATVARIADRPLAEVEHALAEAETARVVVRRPGGATFAHGLLRDELYDGLLPARRRALHRAAAGLARGPAAAWHLLAGAEGDDAHEAVAVARAEAREATALQAFEEAVRLLAAARPLARDRVAIDLLLELSAARLAAGDADDARTEALAAADLARRAADPARLARAALAYAAEIRTAKRDPVMVSLLEEGLTVLDDREPALRARLKVRLGVALVPLPDPWDDAPVRLAREAVAEAVALGDDETTMIVLAQASHAFGYLAPARELIEVTDEAVRLAGRLGRPLAVLDQHVFLVVARLSLGNPRGADAALAEVDAALGPSPHPHHRWRIPSLRAARAAVEGRFALAEALLAEAQDLADQHGVARARFPLAYGRIGLAHARGDTAGAMTMIAPAVALLGPFGNPVLAWALAGEGRVDEARRELARAGSIPSALPVSLFFAEAALRLADRKVAEAALEAVGRVAVGHPLGFGPGACSILGPVAVTLGDLLRLLDRLDPAVEQYESGLALAVRIGARPAAVRARRGLAAALVRRGRREDAARAKRLVAEADALARELGPAPVGPLAVPCPALVTGGGLVRITFGPAEVVLPESKGLRYLEALLSAPDRDLHVTVLAGVDDGDAGEVLDPTARERYRRRLEVLGAALAEAERAGDTARAARSREETDRIADQLAGAVGFGGRARRAGSGAEKARINVQRRLKDALDRISAADDGLGRYLRATIRTGVFCRFEPISGRGTTSG